jgi:hypothetical protein
MEDPSSPVTLRHSLHELSLEKIYAHVNNRSVPTANSYSLPSGNHYSHHRNLYSLPPERYSHPAEYAADPAKSFFLELMSADKLI